MAENSRLIIFYHSMLGKYDLETDQKKNLISKLK